MKFTLEQFDFKNLTKDSILMVEIKKNDIAHFNSAQKSLQAMQKSGKIPAGCLVLVTSKDAPINLREIPREVMNRHGWVKLNIQPNGQQAVNGIAAGN